MDGVAADVVNASRAPGGEQKAALVRAEEAYGRGATPVNRLRLAALLATLPAPLRDEPRATELLQPIADAGTPGTGRLAALLLAQLNERQRLAREIDRLAREHDRSDKERDKREEALRQQVEALRAIERGILEREQRLRRRDN